MQVPRSSCSASVGTLHTPEDVAQLRVFSQEIIQLVSSTVQADIDG